MVTPMAPPHAGTLLVHAPEHTWDVAICDPDDISALLTREVLAGVGYRTHVLEERNLATVVTQAPVLILADPTLTGPADQPIAALRQLKNGEHPAVLVVTANRAPAREAELLDAGADGVLTRPWGPVLLRSTVGAHLRRHLLTCTPAGVR